MIFYGTRAKVLATEVITDKCPNCGTQGSVEIHIAQQYAHVFWIPMVATVKKGVSQCNFCKQVLKYKEMPSNLQTEYNNLKTRVKPPIWMFSGLAILAVFIAFTIVDTKQKAAKNATIIKVPIVGDVFEIKTAENHYTLYKVTAIKGDTVLIIANKYEADKSTALYKIKAKGDSAYSSEEPFIYTKAELKTMFDKGEIMDIDRNK